MLQTISQVREFASFMDNFQGFRTKRVANQNFGRGK